MTEYEYDIMYKISEDQSLLNDCSEEMQIQALKKDWSNIIYISEPTQNVKAFIYCVNNVGIPYWQATDHSIYTGISRLNTLSETKR